METVKVISAKDRKKFINNLYQNAVDGGVVSLPDLDTLSNIAFGGNEQARKLIKKIDRKVKARKLVLPKHDPSNNL
jgi:hypothetical protein